MTARTKYVVRTEVLYTYPTGAAAARAEVEAPPADGRRRGGGRKKGKRR